METLWKSFVVSTLSDALSLASPLRLPRYGFGYDVYLFSEVLAVSGRGSELLVVQQLILDGSEVPRLKVARDSDGRPSMRGPRSEVPLQGAAVSLVRFQADGSERRIVEYHDSLMVIFDFSCVQCFLLRPPPAPPQRLPFPGADDRLAALRRHHRAGVAHPNVGRQSDDLAAKVAALGEVKFLIAPNRMHHLYLVDARARWPAAALLAPAALAEKKPGLRVDHTLEEGLPSEFAGSVRALRIDGAPKLDEFVFFHEGTRTLVVGDLVFNVTRPEGFVANVALLAVSFLALAQSRAWRFFVADRAAAATSARALVAIKPESLGMAHGAAIEMRRGRTASTTRRSHGCALPSPPRSAVAISPGSGGRASARDRVVAHKDHDGPDDGDDEAPDVEAGDADGTDVVKEEPADDGADDAEHHVEEKPFSAPVDDLAADKARNEA